MEVSLCFALQCLNIAPGHAPSYSAVAPPCWPALQPTGTPLSSELTPRDRADHAAPDAPPQEKQPSTP
eukprot:scaffold72934_cov66-Phaeocystis_antarctica.AAC.1